MLRAASLVVSASLIQAPLPGLSPDRDPARLRPGLFLYAAPGVAEPRFGETVVLLLEHGPKGSMGLVVNRPTEVRLGRALKLDDPRADELPLYWGGPVQPEAIHALVRSAGPHGDGKAWGPDSEARTVVQDVHVTGALSDVKAALAGAEPSARLRVYSGYAGWAAGQLAGEVRAGVWVLDRADAASVFSSEPEKLWLRVHRIMNRLEARAAAVPVTIPG